MTPPTDEQLYERARRGDVAAFDQLYARWERRLFGFVLRLLHDRSSAEEVFHDAFIEVLEGPRLSFAQASFSAWLFRVARNACANRLRSNARKSAALQLWPAAEPSPTPEQSLTESERASRLAESVRRLPHALAELFHLRASGLSYEEISTVLGVPLGTVKSRLHTLVHQLKGDLP
ncbi:MAG: sigma-70 family RNA polymerase sigma factor [Archangiaceae bacterium]|nr:sigma-70 family RNA polymerase sigma factor [Archangiaceae bacterium]